MSNNSDYKLPRTQLHKLLPEPYGSAVNTAVFENTFNRFLTKDDTTRVAGYIGDGNTSALVSRQIVESTVAAQANQLQPMMYHKIGSIEYMKTWSDVMLELSRLGVDIDKLDEWGQTQVFNWVPPVDIDKVVNFRDYFWVGSTTPDYITIKNTTNTFAARESFFQRVVDLNGDRFSIVGIEAATTTTDGYDGLIISGDFTHLFETGLSFKVVDSTNTELNDQWVTTIDSEYNITSNTTSVYIDAVFSTPSSSGYLSIREVMDAISQDVIDDATKLPTVKSATHWIDSNQWQHRTTVVDFTAAQQAEAPIIEYDPDMELNEWSQTTHIWKYRPTDSTEFSVSAATPLLIELTPIVYASSGTLLTLSVEYGDLTGTFIPGSVFETNNQEFIEVMSSAFVLNDTGVYQTEVTVEATIQGNAGELYPVVTNAGHPWIGYYQHWVYGGIAEVNPTPHQQPNIYMDTPSVGPIQEATYNYTSTPYTQTYTTTADTNDFILTDIPHVGWDTNLRERSLKSTNDIRVYINGARSEGTFTEMSEYDVSSTGDESYVMQISMTDTIPANTVLRVETGSAAMQDIGWASVPVRTETDDDVFEMTMSTEQVSLISNRRYEQTKTSVNQYPLYDVYDTNGEPTNQAMPLFTYQISQTSDINTHVGKRIVVSDDTVFGFEQTLIGSNNELLTYRSYHATPTQYWFNTETMQLAIWNTTYWETKIQHGSDYGLVSVSHMPPSAPVQGTLWFNNYDMELNQYDSTTWNVISDVLVSDNDSTISSVWRPGTNTDMFIPHKVDWKGRTQDEYELEMNTYVEAGGSYDEWLVTQQHATSTTGIWIGDWNIPDPLYFNNQHENRAIISSSELLSHFNSIKYAQPTQPGIPGDIGDRWHAIPYGDINFGAGGKIHEYNSNFDTLLSSVFVNNVTPPTLIEFAADQYDSLLNSMRETMRNNLYDNMVSVDAEDVVNFSYVAVTQALSAHDADDHAEKLYGDSSTFTDVLGQSVEIGQRNWITTLPFMGIVDAVQPSIVVDDITGIIEVIHHDGHRSEHAFADSTISGIIDRTIKTTDTRVDTNNTFGTQSTLLPPNYTTEFEGGIVDRSGVFWYYVSASTRTLYRLVVANCGVSQPASTHADGTLWMDTSVGDGTLRIKSGDNWNIVTSEGDGLLHNGTDVTDATISAWQVFNVNQYLANLILTVETKLYEAVMQLSAITLHDYSDAQTTDAFNINMENQFTTYVNQHELESPYQNTTYATKDAFTWNYKRSVAGTEYVLLTADASANIITVEGTHASAFVTLPVDIIVKESTDNNRKLTVTSATNNNGNTELAIQETVTDATSGALFVGPTASSATTGLESAAFWKSLYQQLYNTPYPHIEPWKLQGYIVEPDWWVSAYAHPDQLQRRWIYDSQAQIGMWRDISVGIVPSGELLPDGVTISTGAENEVVQYNFFSVDLETDEILPPFYDYAANGYTSDTLNRSVYGSFMELNSLAADFNFGDHGPTEYTWRTSSRFLYDQLISTWAVEPLQVMSDVYGFDTVTVNQLTVDTRTQQTPSHTRTYFHGDVLSTGEVVNALGLNQWYVNYNRYQGFDSTLSNYRQLWTEWTTLLTYQFASFVNTESLELGHRVLPISASDFNIACKKSTGVDDFWVHGLDVTITSVPPESSVYNNEGSWKLSLDTNSSLAQPIEYYGVQKYQFRADVDTNVCSLYTYLVSDVSTVDNSVTIAGNHQDVFAADLVIAHGTEYNNIMQCTYDSTSDNTILSLNDDASQIQAGDTIRLQYRNLPWATGDSIWLTSERTLPTPLLDQQQGIGLIEYFVIVVSDTEFKVANTKAAALSDLHIELSSTGIGNTYVSQLHTTFRALDGLSTNNLWRHHKLDLTTKLTLNPPHSITGMQQLVDIVDGYAATLEEKGVIIDSNNTLLDPKTSRPIGWQIEIERFISDTYALQNRKDVNIGNQFEAVLVDESTGSWTWTDATPQLVTGDAVNLLSTSGFTPLPLVPSVRYFIIVDTTTSFRLASTKLEASRGTAILTTSNVTDTILTICKAPSVSVAYPSQEINPFRNMVRIAPAYGVVSDVNTGPTEDIRNTQLIFDQYGNPLDQSYIRVYREDTLTQIICDDGIVNTRDPSFIFDNPYSYIHIGGAHVFVDTFEHVLMFNGSTIDGNMIYDPFVGLNVTKFEMVFDRQQEATGRPNVGGSYVSNNQDYELRDNFETAINNIRYVYDVNRSAISNPMTTQARKSLGYDGVDSYLTDMNLNEQSQFAFWRGLIQNKGSVKSVNAFINSRRFVDAKVDEYWAYKIAEYGSMPGKNFPELYITTDDIKSNDFIATFIASSEAVPGFGLGGYSPEGIGYDLLDTTTLYSSDGTTVDISIDQTERWVNQPNVLESLYDEGSSLYFDLKVQHKLDLTGLTDITVRHGFATDLEVITVTTQATQQTIVATEGQVDLILSSPFIPDTNHITVFRNGLELTATDYQQTAAIAPSIFATQITMFDALSTGDVIVIVYGTATLRTNTHFDHVTSDVIRFKDAEMLDETFTIMLWGYRVDVDVLNPAKLIDQQSETTLSDIPLWDPARNVHYQQPLAIIDITSDMDPAMYSNTVIDVNNLPVNVSPWNGAEVGTVWWDTSKLDYVPYYDYMVFPNETDRLDNWGALADWSAVTLYEWIETDIHPDDYNAAVAEQSYTTTDDFIPDYLKLSGQPRETIFELNDSDEWVVLSDKFETQQILDSGTLIDGTTSTYELTVSDTLLGLDEFEVNYISIYVNGVVVESEYGIGHEVPLSRVMTLVGVSLADTVTFINYIPDDSIISQGIDDGIYQRMVEHTQTEYVDILGQQRTKYAFWVSSKTVKSKNQLMSVVDAQTQLTTIPIPYMITTNEQLSEIRTDTMIDVDRNWQYVIETGDISTTDFSAQLLGQTQSDFNGAGNNGTFIGGSTQLIVGYQPGYLITMTNGIIIQVESVDALGDVTEFSILRSVESSHTTTGSQMQSYATEEDGTTPVGSTGFMLSNGYANINDTIHRIMLGSTIKNYGVDVDSGAIDSTVVSVIVDGRTLDDTYEFVVNSTGRMITLSQVVGAVGGTTIEVQYVTNVPNKQFTLPNRHVGMIVRGLRRYVTEDSRFYIRFSKDFTLRDSLESGASSLKLKQHHTEWSLIRESSPTKIPSDLWDRITESMLGYKLIDSSTLVPALNRELYDTQYGTSTRYGLGDNQAFTDGDLAISTINTELFRDGGVGDTVDLSTLVASDAFEEDNVANTMSNLYTTLSAEMVNILFFAVLHDAMSLNTQNPDIFKTSMIAVHGIRPFQVEGLFDD